MLAKVGLDVVAMSCGVESVGLPATPSPLLTLTWFAVPVIVRPAQVVAAVLASRPAAGRVTAAASVPSPCAMAPAAEMSSADPCAEESPTIADPRARASEPTGRPAVITIGTTRMTEPERTAITTSPVAVTSEVSPSKAMFPPPTAASRYVIAKAPVTRIAISASESPEMVSTSSGAPPAPVTVWTPWVAVATPAATVIAVAALSSRSTRVDACVQVVPPSIVRHSRASSVAASV